MDPITALALACNVTQLVEQAIEAASVCKEIYERGSLDENNKIEEYANCIAAANKDLEATLNAHKVTPSTHPTRLQKVINDATATTAELKKVLNQLKLSKKQGNKQIGGAFRTTLKAIFKRGVIESLRQKLEQQDAALRSAILKDLYFRAGQGEMTLKDEFKALSQGQRDAIAHVLGGLQAVSNDLVASIKASETVLAARLTSQDVQLERSMRMLSTDIPATVRGAEARLMDRFDSQDSLLKDAARKHIMQTKFFQDQAEDALRDRLLDALAFPEMNERRNMIEGRVVDFGKTYAWVFNPLNEQARIFRNQQRHAFVEWLRTGQEVFWINGKPGSRKNTLMDFIYQNFQSGQQGLVHLEAWAHPQPVRLLSFWFFRPAASRLLKSLDGF
ncbi:uncharacterized protein Z519_12303 [Cladophialophora bantiana CBS 173.52]|uniref:Fungal N-terminal domain-containing protein n=1 Tax=Cladophialophora bantiana (strain ATCC 10958 / CBS 173.52 / CDC B-1940 / NIH 8579) TaxID=1442370 RepID=A0A0D2EAB3_CLAB1|nr:uncharacterized protein Z519_12303 [Cladophialophora bantiana CBS 173.52]KIW87006.1 hypothetical protein Z519_12303 [Cladophialophora bantiana CBS 173.52]